MRVGGHTSCVVVSAVGDGAPRLVLDAGTGLRAVSDLLDGRAFHGTILLTHLHWDHWQGLPFFAAGDRVDARVRVLAPDHGEPLVEVLRRSMAPPHFPIGPEGLKGQWSFESIDEGPTVIEGFEVVACQVPHKGGRTFGYRITEEGRTLVYLPDHQPASDGALRTAALELAAGADVLVHDAQFLAHEAAVADEFGHCTVPAAVEFARQAGVGELVLFHHAPTRSDDAVAEIAAGLDRGGLRVTVAVQGTEQQV